MITPLSHLDHIFYISFLKKLVKNKETKLFGKKKKEMTKKKKEILGFSLQILEITFGNWDYGQGFSSVQSQFVQLVVHP